MRKLTASEVTFTIELEEDDTPVRGSRYSGDPDYADADRAEEDEIIARLNRGEVEAWCGVVVTAHWEFEGTEYEGTDSIWGNTLSADYTAETVVSEHGMRETALDDLNTQLERLYARLSAVAAHLEVAS